MNAELKDLVERVGQQVVKARLRHGLVPTDADSIRLVDGSTVDDYLDRLAALLVRLAYERRWCAEYRWYTDPISTDLSREIYLRYHRPLLLDCCIGCRSQISQFDHEFGIEKNDSLR